VYWGALSTGISEPGRKRLGFFIRAGGEGRISFADPVAGGGISFADPVAGGGISFADPVAGGGPAENLQNPCALGASVFYFRSQKASFRAPEIKKPTINRGFCKFSAVRAGFEPAVHLRVRQFSKLVVSASHPPHLLLPNGLIRSPVKIDKIHTGVQIYTDFGN
jgi:hypothetical protein